MIYFKANPCDVSYLKGCELVGGFEEAWNLGVEGERIRFPRYGCNTTENLQGLISRTVMNLFCFKLINMIKSVRLLVYAVL